MVPVARDTPSTPLDRIVPCGYHRARLHGFGYTVFDPIGGRTRKRQRRVATPATNKDVWPPQDIDDTDQTIRRQLAATLIRTRKDAGMSQDALAARLGVTQEAAGAMERRTTWQIRTVQRWARALDRVLHLHLRDLPLPPEPDITTITYQAALHTAPDPASHDRAALHLTHHTLNQARRQAAITDTDLATQFGVTTNAVRWFWDHPDGITLIGLQRTTRAAGGHLDLTLHHPTT